MFSIDEKTLTITDELELKETDAIVQAVITGMKTYDTLVVKENKNNNFGGLFEISQMNEFWAKLGQSVTTLILKLTLTRRASVLEKYFTNVRSLHLNYMLCQDCTLVLKSYQQVRR